MLENNVKLFLFLFLSLHFCNYNNNAVVVYAFQVGQQQQQVGSDLPTTQPKELPSLVSTKNNNSNNGCTLIPLSREPMMFTTSQPILSEGECNELSRYFHSQKKDCNNNNGEDNDNNIKGRIILRKLQQHIDALILRPSGETLVQPRFLEYEPSSSEIDVFKNVQTLLQDGLHVDTNNNMYFRYLTVLVYLTDSISGATTFPLAKRLPKSYNNNNNNNVETDKQNNENNNAALHIAQSLINEQSIQHTRYESANLSITRILEQSAYDLYSNKLEHSTDEGIRVLPKQGHVLIFSGIDESTGLADPRSWHGSEAILYNDQKELLSFFYEIPTYEFTSRIEFAQRVNERKQLLWKQYINGIC